MQMLRNPRVLWICSALGLMLAAVAFSGSRGGLLAMVGAAVLCGVLGRLRLGSSFRLGPSLVVAAVVMALLAWFGTDLIKDRLATLESGEAFESRLPLWLRSLPIVANFPIWGTGYGTFGYIEPMYRPDSPSTVELEPVWFDHVHNDYLEILVEGGVVGLGLVVLVLVAVFRRGYRALALNRGSRRAGLALGALFAFTALALHNFGEFGSHIPSIALLATVVCAHLYALGQPIPRKAPSVNTDESLRLAYAASFGRDEHDAESDTYRLRLGGIAPLFGVIAAFGFGLTLCADSWKAHRIDRLKDAAFRAGNVEADQLRTRIACLTEAVSLGPVDAQLHYELGLSHERLAGLLRVGNSSDRRAALEQFMLALEEHLHARDACPLLSGPQAGIASYASLLKRGESAENHMRRAKLLSPGQVEMWYVCGLRELTLNRPHDAWATWRHCLELSDQYLAQILGQTSYLKTNQLLEKVLPDRPDVLLAAALYLYPDFGSVQRRRPFLEKALRLLESQEGGTGQRDALVKARIYKALDQPDQAILSYREFLNRDASQMRVRYEFASYLHEVRKPEESQRELMVILAQESKNGAAKSLLDTVVHDMLQEKKLQRKRQWDDWWSRHQQR
jgi:tetratricopeptide (TPR) repeat protein